MPPVIPKVNEIANGEAGLDDLISAIRTGKAFGGSEVRQHRKERSGHKKEKSKDKTDRNVSGKERGFFQSQEQGVLGRLKRPMVDKQDMGDKKF